MKVYINWSGESSRYVAEALRNWLKDIFHSLDPWMAEEDLRIGSRWSNKFALKLEETKIGILCLTPDNIKEPWILFEAGALSEKLESTFVLPYLFKVDKQSLNGPLAQFQALNADQEDTRKLLSTINQYIENPLDDIQLDAAFIHLWPEFEKRLRKVHPVRLKPEHILTMRGTPVVNEINEVGLVDIENRDDKQRELPPEEFYSKAKKEVVITGVSLYQTFHKNIKLIKKLISEGKHVYVMLLHPNSPDVSSISQSETRGIYNDIKATIETIKKENLNAHPNFDVRFFKKLPPFIGVMIDGDINAKENDAKPKDSHGQVRIQPRTMFVSVHSGLIIQLKKVTKEGGRLESPFVYFARDFRKQWEQNGIDDPDLYFAETEREFERQSQKKIDILFMGANPTDNTRLRVDEEIRSIDEAIRKSEYREGLELRQHWAVRISDLPDYLQRYKPNIVHFSGHGSVSNQLIFEDDFGESHEVPIKALSKLFLLLKDDIKCVILNACYSEKQAMAIAEHIDFVIGVPSSIEDKVSINFSIAFYQALGYGRDIKTAFELGCAKIDLEGICSDDKPKLISLRANPALFHFVK